jgi:hypothetical protein
VLHAGGAVRADAAVWIQAANPPPQRQTDRTEIDLKLGDLMAEAKLTETDFQTAHATMIKRYRDLDEVFDEKELVMSDVVRNY